MDTEHLSVDTEMTEAEVQANLNGFFELLLEVDKRVNSHLYA